MVVVMLFSACDPSKSKTSSSSGATSSEPPVISSAPISSEPVSSEETSSEPTTMSSMEELPAVAISAEAAELLGDLSAYENEEKNWGQGRQVNDKNRPITCDQYQPKYEENGGVFIMPEEEKKIYLTFDEGYENGYTEKILDVLKEKQCPAVFFVTMPYVKSNAELVQRMIDEGHIVGNHTVNHKSMPTLSPDEQIEELSGLHNYMVENFNYQMTLFRPPMGNWSTQSMHIAKQLGYKTVLWSFAYLDYDVKNQPEKETAFERVTGAAHNGAVYLLHAVSQTNTEILSEVIDNFRESGYEMTGLR